jgi:hypothetical protein
MSLCRACHHLNEKQTKVKPHAQLAREDVRRHIDGALETFQCRKCGTRWERIVPRPYFRARPLVWKVI